MMIKQFCKIDLKQENAHVRRCLHISNKHCLIEFNYSKKLTMYDALLTTRRTQMWVQVKDSGSGSGREAFPSSQHLEG
jgi:hypothetical protein